MSVTFDECFQTFPELKPPSDLEPFWKNAEGELRQIPVDGNQKLILKKSLGWESTSEVNFQSLGGEKIRGQLSIPRKRGNVPAVISFHDYHNEIEAGREFTDQGLAHLAIRLRGHEPAEARGPQEPEQVAIPHFQQSGLASPEKSYPYACFLDALRAVDFLRLQKGIDTDRIGVIGRGFGAALAVFAAFHREQVRALALEQMGFTWLLDWAREAQADYAEEIRFLTGKNARNRLKARKSLEYFDVLNYAEELKQPVLAFIVLDDARNPARAAFAFFNHLKSEKTMELFPETGDLPPAGEIRKKSVNFLAEILNVP